MKAPWALIVMNSIQAVVCTCLALWYRPDGPQWLLRLFFILVAASATISLQLMLPPKQKP